jgi:hypothetical protein
MFRAGAGRPRNWRGIAEVFIEIPYLVAGPLLRRIDQKSQINSHISTMCKNATPFESEFVADYRTSSVPTIAPSQRGMLGSVVAIGLLF